MKFDFIQDDFSGGEITPRAQGRVSSELWKSCVAKMQNAIPCDQGSFQSRSGLMRAPTDPLVGNLGAPVKLIPIQDTPLGDIILEVANGTLRMLNKRGQLLPWNGLLYNFEAPPGQNLLGPSPSTQFGQGWFFSDDTGAPASFVDPVDNKICLRNIAGTGLVSVFTSDILSELTYPTGTSGVFSFTFTFSGDPIGLVIADGATQFVNNSYSTPGTYTVTFTPTVGHAQFNINFNTTFNALASSNIWGFSIIKDGMKTEGTFTAPTSVPASWLNEVRDTSFWAETNSSDQQIFITPPSIPQGPPYYVSGTLVANVTIGFTAIGGTGAYVWSLGSTTGFGVNGSIDATTGVYTTGAGVIDSADLVICTDSSGNTATVAVPIHLTYALNPYQMAPLFPGQTITVELTQSTATVYVPSFEIPAGGNLTGGNVTAAGVYTVGPYASATGDTIADSVTGTSFQVPSAVPTKVDYFFIVLALAGQATPLVLRYRTPQMGDNPLIPQWTLTTLAVRQNPGTLFPLPPLSEVVAVAYDQSRLILGFDNTFGNVAACGVGPKVNSDDLEFSFLLSSPLLATDALNLRLDAPKGTIVWMNVLRGLLLGTTRNEKLIAGALLLDPATGQAPEIVDESSIGSDPALPALDVNDKVLFFTHGRRSMRLAGLNIQSNGGLVAEDPGFLGEHLLYRRVRSFCFLKTPVQRLVFAFDDGSMAIATLAGSDIATAAPWKQPFSWNEVDLPDLYKAYSVAALDSDDGSTLWVGTEAGQSLLVTNLDSRQVVKYQTETPLVGSSPPRQQFDQEQMPPIMDGWVRRPLSGVGVINGLPAEFLGQSVSLIVNGVYAGTAIGVDDGSGGVQVLYDGAVTWDTVGSKGAQAGNPSEAFCGLAYPNHEVVLLPLEGGNPLGTAQGLKSRMVNCYIRLVDSYLPLVGGKRTAERTFTDPLDAQAGRVTGDVRVTQLGFNRNQQLVISMDLPLRMEVSAVYGGTQVNPL